MLEAVHGKQNESTIYSVECDAEVDKQQQVQEQQDHDAEKEH